MKKTNKSITSIKNVAVLSLILVLFLTGCTKKSKEDITLPEEGIVEVLEIEGVKYSLVKEKDGFVFYDEDKNITKDLTDKHLEILKKYKIDENDVIKEGEKTPSIDPSEVTEPDVNTDTPGTVTDTPKEPGNTVTKPVEPTKPTEPTKPKEPTKPSDKITYGDIEYVDTAIAFKKLEDKADSTKENGTSGILTKGVNGISRKEVRKVYVNGKHSHTETVKNSYVYKQPVHQQGWYGTKVVSKPGKHRPDYVKEVIRLINIERTNAGLNTLNTGNQKMEDLAKVRAKEIYTNDQHGGSNKGYAEAIYKNIVMTPKQAVDGWMNSSGHKKILMSSTAKSFSVGVWQEDDWVCYVVLTNGE